MGVPALEAEFTDVDLKDALRVCLVMAAEESFQREIKALWQRAPIPRDSVWRKINPLNTINPSNTTFWEDVVQIRR